MMLSRTNTLLTGLIAIAGSFTFSAAPSFAQAANQSSPATSPAISPVATTAQNISCEASIPVGNGNTLIYQVTGQIDLDAAGNQSRPTEADSKLKMTVQKRSREGQVLTLLSRTTIKNFEIIGPDADYSILPFTGSFRGLSNDGAGIYSATASQHGLYASLRPFQGIPPKIQVVHYLSAARSVRSTTGVCRAIS